MVPSEGGKHIFKKLALCRMEIQQNLKAVWKKLENIMTIDEEMKDLSAKEQSLMFQLAQIKAAQQVFNQAFAEASKEVMDESKN